MLKQGFKIFVCAIIWTAGCKVCLDYMNKKQNEKAN